MTQVEDQGDTNSCTANAVAGACEYLIKRKLNDKAYDISRLFIYYNARKRESREIEDQGCVIQYAVESLKHLGSCPEKVWPFTKKIVNRQPEESAYTLAQRFRVEGLERVPSDLDSWKMALAEGNPIVFGTELYESFDDCCNQGGFVAMPAPDDVGRASHGGHAMLCVGYSEAEQVFIVRNSWGEAWGDQGYCYMPYNYLINPKLTDDCWILKSPFGTGEPKAGWVNAPAPLTAKKYSVPVYAAGDYGHVPGFFDRTDLTVLEYVAELPDLYHSIVNTFFNENASADDWDNDSLDGYDAATDDTEDEADDDNAEADNADEGDGSTDQAQDEEESDDEDDSEDEADTEEEPDEDDAEAASDDGGDS